MFVVHIVIEAQTTALRLSSQNWVQLFLTVAELCAGTHTRHSNHAIESKQFPDVNEVAIDDVTFHVFNQVYFRYFLCIV